MPPSDDFGFKRNERWHIVNPTKSSYKAVMMTEMVEVEARWQSTYAF